MRSFFVAQNALEVMKELVVMTWFLWLCTFPFSIHQFYFGQRFSTVYILDHIQFFWFWHGYEMYFVYQIT
eukprot:UN08158